ncbi:MAG: bifunctional metallophosphatase/5'-nucleotidase [Thermoanaerobaculum sp.]
MSLRPWFFAFVASLVAFSAFAAAPGEVTLAVVFTSDVHAHVLPYDDVRQCPARGSLAQVASLVNDIRRQHPLTVVLDGGDAIQGTPLSHYVLTGQMGEGRDPTVVAMNLVGYDAAVVGNHEFNYGLEPLRRAVTQSLFPWLAANLEGAGAAKLPVRSWVILQRGPVRVGVLGLTNPRVPYWDPPEHWQPLGFGDPVAVAEKAIAQLRPQVDLLIVVAHTGFERDLESGQSNGSEEENFAWRLSQLSGVDILLTGHTHRDIPPRKLNNAWVAQPGRWAELLTFLTVRLRREGGRYSPVEVEGRNLPTGNGTPDPRVLAELAHLSAQVKAELDRPLGTLDAPLSVGGVPVEDEPGLDLIHRVQLWATGAQLSLAAPVAASPGEFPPGPLTPRLAHALYVYPNTLVVVRVTGEQLKAILEHAVRGFSGLRCQGQGPVHLVLAEGIPTYNYDTLEGAEYVVDPTAPEGQRVRWLAVGGQPVTGSDTLTLVVNSYRAAGGGGYPFLRDAPRVRVVDQQVVDLLVQYFARMGHLVPEASRNWWLAPRLTLAPAARR